ncbi:MAG: two-component regulator propeller domain-containing protein [Saprospiraceae bacterium]
MLIAWSLWVVPYDVTAQENFNFTRISYQDGLASNVILSMIQDDQGFLWIGTENGLNRYDGQHFLNFRFDPQDPESLSGNFIYALFEDSRQRLWVGTFNGLNLLIKNTGKFKRIPILDQEGKEITVRINAVYEDEWNNIWISTDSHGLFRLNEDQTANSTFAVPFAYQTNASFFNQQVGILEIIHIEKEYMWVSTEAGIDRLHIPSGKIDHFLIPSFEGISLEGHERGDLWDNRGTIFLHRRENAYFFNIGETDSGIQPFEAYFAGLSVKPRSLNEVVLRFQMDEDRRLLVASPESMKWIDLVSGATTYLDQKTFDKQALSSFPINKLLLDQQGNIWIGTYGGGISVGWRRTDFMNFYQHDPEDPSSISSGQIRSLVKDDQGNLWLGTLTSGLDKCTLGQDGKLQRIQNIQTLSGVPKEFNDNEIIQLTKDLKGKIWISTSRKGLFRMDPLSLQFEHFLYTPQSPPGRTISENRIWGLQVDPSNKVWIGTWSKGLNYLDPETGLVKQFQAGPDKRHSLLSNYIRTLYLESDSILWIGTRDGLSRMNIQDETFTHFFHVPADPTSLSNNLIWSIFEDRQKALWIGTSVGLNKFNRQTGQFERFFENDGLPNNSIFAILEDRQGTLWISTQDGLATKLPDQTKTVFQPIISSDGLQSSGFLPKAHFLDRQTGVLLFGTVEGVVAIKPQGAQQNDSPFNPHIHTVSTFNISNSENRTNEHYYLEEKETPLKLTHQDRIIEITFSDLSWDFGTRYKYEYRLSDFSNQWIEIGREKIMTFTNLAPGTYTLSVRRKSLDQRTSPEMKLVSLRVFPPWWKTWWAYTSYLILMAGLIYSWYRYQLQRQLQKQETENLRALDAFKNELYTNITHEFRTPLTVISGMADQIVEPIKTKELIKRNSLNLLNLVNQILDLRKLESGKLKLELVQGDMVQYLRFIMASYEMMAEMKGVNLHFIPKERELFMDFDQEKFLRIISNLLSNAIKFTPENGQVYLILEKRTIERETGQMAEVLYLNVTDTGAGIPKEKQAYIFDRFYQVEEDSDTKTKKYQYRGPGSNISRTGSGIGLALTKDLITLMGGSISLESAPGQGSSFTVQLPISQEAMKVEVEQQTVEALSTLEFGQEGIKNETGALLSKAASVEKGTELSLLIIEDNRDVQQYLITLLEPKYTLYLADNGREGIEMAFEHMPDLIISDVMMPEKDGFEVCDTLKKDDRTSHIPIVLLTAKASVESRIQGLERGADAYLAKPFNEKELFIRLEKLAELRRLLQQRYQHIRLPAETIQSPATATNFAKEDAFMAKLQKIVETHLDNTDFGPTQLCEAMGMSRSHLHLKIKALTNRSTSIFIRTIRLHKAKELLQAGKLNVTQVAFEVGFNDLSYFSRKFTEEFGVNPQKVVPS